MNPAWRPIPGFPAYEVSASGRVRSVATQYVLTPRKGIVALSRDGKAHRCAVRDLVAAAWAEDSGNGMKVSDVKPSSGVDHASKPDRTAVCLVTLAPAPSAELLDLAAEFDCLVDLYWTLDEVSHQAAKELKVAEKELATSRASRGVLEERLNTTTEALSDVRTENRKQAEEIGRLEADNAKLRTENEIRQRTNNRLEETNDLLSEQIAKLKARPAAKPTAKVLTADEKDAEIARLRGMVAELEAELALYRASAEI